jgi:hypothetical protein
MSRLMSVAFTEAAVVARTKTVTRRKGWLMLKPGDRLTLCRKVMGRKKGEPLVRLAEVEVVSVTRGPLCTAANLGELEREGCGHMSYGEFWERYFEPQGIASLDDVTRIEWRYLDDEAHTVKDRMLDGIAKGWSRLHPIGTPILYWPGVMEGPGVESVVRSEAWVMSSGHAVAKVEGYAGGIALTHIAYRDAEQAAKAEEIRDEIKADQS